MEQEPQQGQAEPQDTGFWSAIKNNLKNNAHLQGALVGALATLVVAGIGLYEKQQELDAANKKLNQEATIESKEAATEPASELERYERAMKAWMAEQDYTTMQEKTPSALTNELSSQEDKAGVVQFLYGRGWIQKYNPTVPLRGASLEKANLYDVTLSEADQSDAKLGEADLSDARLGEADMRLAKLSSDNLSRTILSSAYLNIADLSGVDLREANLEGARLNQANLSPYTARGAST